MADLKEDIFANDTSQHYDFSALPMNPPVFPHEISPIYSTRPAAQRRQFLHPNPSTQSIPSVDAFKPVVPAASSQSSQPLQSSQSVQAQEQQKLQFAPKLSLPTNRLPVSPDQSPAASIAPAASTAFRFQPVQAPVAPAPTPVAMVSPPTQNLGESPVADASFYASATITMPPPVSSQSFLPLLPIPPVSPVPQMPPVPPAPTKPKRKRKQKKPKKKMTRGRLMRRIMVVCSILTIIVFFFTSQANGASGAWTADALRAVLGPSITAQIESWYLGLSDTTHQIQYKLSGQQVVPPWSIGVSPVVTTTPPPKVVPLSPMPLNRITPAISPALAGEGQWATQSVAPAPYSYLPLDARAFIRPDPSHPYAIVTLLQFDTRFFRLHMVAGTTEPGGPRGYYGSGVIPAADQKGNVLLAAFNGGFKYADGQYGLKTNGIVYVPPQPNAATIAVTKSGQILLGAWGVDPQLTSSNTDLVAWRQNASLLINNGTINPLTQDGAAWGGTVLNSAYTWRSGIGITANGTLIYAAGSSLTALTLGEALKAAGAVMAMQTDINPFWVRAFLYDRNAQGVYTIIKLNPAMYGTGTEYLSSTERDFFYLTRFAPPPPPPVIHPREAPSQ